MTDREQAVSFAYGNLKLDRPDLKREDVERAYDKHFTSERRIKVELPDVELVAAKVHEAWINGKLAKGIASRKAEDGEELMVPYGELSEPQKDQDRQTVLAVYLAIEAL